MLVHIAAKGPLWFFLVLGLLASFGSSPQRGAVLQSLVAAVAVRGLNEGLGRLYHRDRPFLRPGIQPLLAHRPSASFPSNHAACAFALAVPILGVAPLTGGLLLGMATLLAFSRVYVGVHYPLDVIGGAAIGTVLALLLPPF